jgi:hypothetical protein
VVGRAVLRAVEHNTTRTRSAAHKRRFCPRCTHSCPYLHLSFFRVAKRAPPRSYRRGNERTERTSHAHAVAAIGQKAEAGWEVIYLTQDHPGIRGRPLGPWVSKRTAGQEATAFDAEGRARICRRRSERPKRPRVQTASDTGVSNRKDCVWAHCRRVWPRRCVTQPRRPPLKTNSLTGGLCNSMYMRRIFVARSDGSLSSRHLHSCAYMRPPKSLDSAAITSSASVCTRCLFSRSLRRGGGACVVTEASGCEVPVNVLVQVLCQKTAVAGAVVRGECACMLTKEGREGGAGGRESVHRLCEGGRVRETAAAEAPGRKGEARTRWSRDRTRVRWSGLCRRPRQERHVAPDPFADPWPLPAQESR